MFWEANLTRREIRNKLVAVFVWAAAFAFVEAAVVERDDLRAGDRVAGPAAIVEPQTTTWVASGHQAVLQADGCLRITSDGESAP